jgi:pimeloyl-ACP methyl ester carboxylesterase
LTAQEPPPLILFSGLAADANIFMPQKTALPQLVVPKWLTPQPHETLDSYCDRLADELRSHSDPIIGGASFGGIIALHVAQRLKPRAVLLIGSVHSPAELPMLARFSRPLKPLVALVPVRFLQLCCSPIASRFAQRFIPHLCGLTRQFCEAEPAVIKWSVCRILDWKTTPKVGCPVFHIHGDRDFVLPMRYTKPDCIVQGGGHVISLTHPTAVNEFIRSTITRVTADQRTAH